MDKDSFFLRRNELRLLRYQSRLAQYKRDLAHYTRGAQCGDKFSQEMTDALTLDIIDLTQKIAQLKKEA